LFVWSQFHHIWTRKKRLKEERKKKLPVRRAKTIKRGRAETIKRGFLIGRMSAWGEANKGKMLKREREREKKDQDPRGAVISNYHHDI